MRTKTLTVGIFLGLVALVFLKPSVPPGCPPKTGIDTSLATYEKLRLGMPEEEVEAIIGGRAGRYTSERYLGSVGVACSRREVGDYERQWETDEGTIIVKFGTERGAVFIQRMQGFVRESLPDKLNRYLRSFLSLTSDPNARYRLP
jgi:hypothetical protein